MADRRPCVIFFIFFLGILILGLPAYFSSGFFAQTSSWNISSDSRTIADWTRDILFADQLFISTRILSIRDDGIFLDAGSQSGVAVGQIFEVYRSEHSGLPVEVLGKVQVAWTREDYSFAEPRESLRLEDVTILHFARLLTSARYLNISRDMQSAGFDELLQSVITATESLLRGSDITIVRESTSDRSWRLKLSPDSSGTVLDVTLLSPSGQITGTMSLNPVTGEKLPSRTELDPSYLDGSAAPFSHYIAPPERRTVKITAGNILAGRGDELVVLDGTEVWIYDLSGAQARLLSSLDVDIPAGMVRHREDIGSLVAVDIDGNGHHELCIAPTGGRRGEIWRLDGDEWVLLGYLPFPARSVNLSNGSVLIAPYMAEAPVYDPSSISWYYPLSDAAPERFYISFPVLAAESMPGSDSTAIINPDGILMILGSDGSTVTIPGRWGSCVRSAFDSSGSVLIATSPQITSDALSIIDPASGFVVSRFPFPNGPIIDIALGDIDRDNFAEIIVAVLEPDGLKIYY